MLSSGSKIHPIPAKMTQKRFHQGKFLKQWVVENFLTVLAFLAKEEVKPHISRGTLYSMFDSAILAKSHIQKLEKAMKALNYDSQEIMEQWIREFQEGPIAMQELRAERDNLRIAIDALKESFAAERNQYLKIIENLSKNGSIQN